mmetsp:Transcript_1056/g.2289  ORF Transcript_1056/g.2289 Transcript_1056/m.2289 type:complete len:92 (-) Transcript_1056:243-518(-)
MKFRRNAPPKCETNLYDAEEPSFGGTAFPASPRASTVKRECRNGENEEDRTVLSQDVTEVAANGRMKSIPRSSRSRHHARKPRPTQTAYEI